MYATVIVHIFIYNLCLSLCVYVCASQRLAIHDIVSAHAHQAVQVPKEREYHYW
jgi:hypothetical protein